MMEKGKTTPAPEQEVPQEAAGRAEQEAMEELAGTGEDNEPEDLVLKLSKPYVFEGRTYEELDLSGLENATAGDLARAAKITSKKHRGLNAATLEMTAEYAAVMGHLVTKLPLEFFERMPAKDAIALKGKVVGFLFNADGEE